MGAFQIQRRDPCSIDGRPGIGFGRDLGHLVSSRHYERFMAEPAPLSRPRTRGWSRQAGAGRLNRQLLGVFTAVEDTE